jgi:serine/threonine protein kinase
VKVFRPIVFAGLEGPDAVASRSGTPASFFGGLGATSSGNSAPLRYLDSFFRMHGPGGGSSGDAAAGAACERELLLLASLRHPNIASLYGVVTTPPMLVLELCPGGSLLSLLQGSTLASLPWRRRLDIAVGVACGVEFLHAQQPPVIHRDLKSANVVLNEAQTPKLVDFGLSDLLPHASRDLAGAAEGLHGLKGTAAFIAPELVLAATGAAVADGTPQAVDMFGVGVVLHDLGHLGLTAAERRSSEDAASADATGSGHLGSVQLLTQRLVTGFDVQVRDKAYWPALRA